ncbi:response regulator transcription factor [Enterococcus sp. 669A]|uniref:Response regulator transcription factor n=1 Tax=Candidatus Enterococcus moelleringii TaxID=2815325 RepID=A0ABS3LFK1_9ENTE|nr:response regulator transcription factor [Enterococcus sp. 669A]MBO1308424.1 response regulator transcription factor [Enterococcus sp. 669A]
MKKILLVEDDLTLAKGVALSLQSPTIEVKNVDSLKRAEKCLADEAFHLLLLDINLPDGNGLEFCQKIKQQLSLPIILLTARDLEVDIVSGFSVGADDYVTKPFSLAILRARVEALLRRYEELTVGQKRVSYLNSTFDFAKQEFLINGTEIAFSKIEQKLLQKFFENLGITLTRASLSNEAWQLEAEFVEENALSVAIKRLRSKLTDCRDLKIVTVYGIGYRMERHYD